MQKAARGAESLADQHERYAHLYDEHEGSLARARTPSKKWLDAQVFVFLCVWLSLRLSVSHVDKCELARTRTHSHMNTHQPIAEAIASMKRQHGENTARGAADTPRSQRASHSLQVHVCAFVC